MTWTFYALHPENLPIAILIFLVASPWFLVGSLLGHRALGARR